MALGTPATAPVNQTPVYEERIYAPTTGTGVWTIVRGSVLQVPNRALPTDDDRLRFQRLASQWREETRALSSDSDIVSSFAYQQIIGMGEKALPLIFSEMQAHGGRWFWALRAITGANPVPREDRGNVRRMTDRWLEWAREREYV